MGQQADNCETSRLNKCPIIGKQKALTYSTARGKTDRAIFLKVWNQVIFQLSAV